MITIEKAIEILELNSKEAGKKMPPDVLSAVNLGIEAMKRIDRQRNLRLAIHQPPLPGENII